MVEANELQVSLEEMYHWIHKTPIFDGPHGRTSGLRADAFDRTESNSLLENISHFAQEGGVTETHKDTLTSPRTPKNTGHRASSYDWILDVEYHHIVYACASVAALAAFLKNTISTIKDWKDLSKGSRSVRILVHGEKIRIDDNMDVETVLKLIEDRLKTAKISNNEDQSARSQQ